ncbi:inositol 1,4,5-triphosphate receptor associated 2-like [Scyliorhinus canicula]|uniref:inositol 1,4,5-triphosphate receptor associated 2-like n=1 Tax=Scyliorhinus canicula TaxID=7830 RepID=UPI0018F2E4E1|nr:inositol 1,4,5-triphosphate receptor associated 2-like [Scyliorhinus canicula]
MSSPQKLLFPLQRSQSTSSLLPVSTTLRDNTLHPWGQKATAPSSEVTLGEQQSRLKGGFVLLSKEELKQQQSEPESLIFTWPQPSSLESEITPENDNIQCDSRTSVEEQVGFSDESGEDSGPEEPLNTSMDEVSILKRLGLHREFYTEKDIESAFIHLSLAFKSDMFTLKQRLEVEERARDVAEENIRKELEGCKIIQQKLKAVCLDGQRKEILKQLERNLQILETSISRVVNKSEILGAVHQEARMSRSVQVMVEHVENLKSMHAKEHAELQEMKKIIQQNSRNRQFGDMRDDADFQTKHQMMRAMHQSTARRRVSIAVIPKQLVTFHIPDSKITDSEDHRMDYNSSKISLYHGPLSNSRRQNSQKESTENIIERTESDTSQQMLSSENSEKEDEEICEHGPGSKWNWEEIVNQKSGSGEASNLLSDKTTCPCARQNQEEKIGMAAENGLLNNESPETESETEDWDEFTSDTASESSMMLEQLPSSSGVSCFFQTYQKILTSIALTLIVAWLLQPFTFSAWK